MASKLDQATYQANYGRRAYWLGVLIGLDQLANAMLWGYNDETLSSRAYRGASAINAKRRWRWARAAIDALFWRDRQTFPGGVVIRHCQLAYLGELAHEHLPRDFSVPTSPARSVASE